jgi:hypothetical protein
LKTTTFPFPIRSKFLDTFTRAIRAHRGELLVGKEVPIPLSPGGYERHVVATIDGADPRHFRIDFEFEERRLSARLRAAALALYHEGLFGRFELAHKDGLLTIRLTSA